MTKVTNKTNYQEAVSEKSYFESRMEELGITPQDYQISLLSTDDSTVSKIKDIFSKAEHDNIQILFPNLDGGVYTYATGNKNIPDKTFYRTRLKSPVGDMKYKQPSGSGIIPFFPPKLLEKYNNKTEIRILYLIEGEFKAFKGSLHGLDIIGITGKDMFVAEKGSKELHPDIIRVIKQCKVKTIVLLLDADTRIIKWEQDKELTERPYSFLNAVQKFNGACELLINQDDTSLRRIYFSHIKPKFIKNGKGLDDLLISEKEKANQVIWDLAKLDKAQTYFDGINIGDTTGRKQKKFFGLDSFESFHSLYSEYFGSSDVVYFGATYTLQNGKYIVTERNTSENLQIILSEKMKNEVSILSEEDKSRLFKKWRNDSSNYGIISTKDGYMAADIDQTKKHISFTPISNFTLIIKYHIKTSKNNKRVIELENDNGHKVSIDIETKQLSSFQLFKEFTEGQGNFRFYGKNSDLDKLKAKWFTEEKSCIQLEILGYHKEGFFTFSNGILTNTFHPLDNDGVVSLNNRNYFIPYHNPQDENQFINERKFHFRHSEVTFTDWAKAYINVYGNEGHVMLLFAIGCIFSDIIYKDMGNFPMLFLQGEGGSGKSRGVSFVQSLYGIPQPALKLSEKANTDKSKIRKLAQYVNAIAFMEEYVNTLDDATIKTLTGIYDRLGYERANMTTNYGTDSIPINSGVIISGNDYPNNDPLVQRLIVLEFLKNEFTDHEREKFQQLKELTDKGITVVLAEILKHRNSFETSFNTVLGNEASLLSKIVREKGIMPTERMIQSYSMILSIYQIISPLLSIPIKYESLRDFLVEKISYHNERRNVQGDIQGFWDIFLIMAGKAKIYNDIQYRFLEGDKLAIKFKYVHLLYLQQFQETHRKQGLSSSALRQKLTAWKGFIDNKDVKFGGKTTSAMVFDYTKCNIDLDHAIRHISPNI